MIRLAYDNARQRGDLIRSGGNLEDGGDLETAVILSLFLNRRADADDETPSPDDRRGYWGDAYAEVAGDTAGSRLWLLARSKATRDRPQLVVSYIEEALAWMVEDGVATSVRGLAEWHPGGVLAFGVEIARPTAPDSPWRLLWEVHVDAL